MVGNAADLFARAYPVLVDQLVLVAFHFTALPATKLAVTFHFFAVDYIPEVKLCLCVNETKRRVNYMLAFTKELFNK
ncbi:hypothetical protein A0256_20120 [Mucilaginibacter sp. PAMC 26640]|nr:hypothetical protein A0256_20120 [Mucilaginibacter sp. PAMC 26640]